MKITLNNLNDIYKSKIVSIETMELKGYELIENLFVDNSRMGADNEPAYTQTQFEVKLTELLTEHGPLYATVTDQGQFQVYIGLFKKIPGRGSKVEKIGNNTLKVSYLGADAIRLHNTDILVFQSDHVTLDSGGWQTKTTKDRMNQYLPNGVHIEQKNFEWFVIDARDGTKKEFVDGMTIAS